MDLPIIFVVDDDPQVLRALERDLKREFRKNYKILSTNLPVEALESLKELKNKGGTVALFISDQRMPVMEGIAFLEQSKTFFPDAKRVLLTAYSDTGAAIKAINDVRLDYYLMKPWDPPEEKLFPIINDLLQDWSFHFVPEFSGLRVLGYQFSPKSHVLKDFLSGNLLPYEWNDITRSEKAKELLRINHIDNKDLPAVFFNDGSFLIQPSIAEIAQKVGLSSTASANLYDVVVIGGGPAGLAASVYGASEGLKTLLIEKRAPGGQAGTSSRIENYLGFPVGLSGADLTRRAITQATRFGTEVLTPQEVVEINAKDQYKTLKLADGNEIVTKSVVITTGVSYRKLEIEGIDQFTGAGIYYGSAITEANSCGDEDIYIVGGGNSAGQAAMYLSKFAKNVFILIRKSDLGSTMSSYLVDQIKGTENIHVTGNTEVSKVNGDERMRTLCLRSTDGQQERQVNAGALFIFIGANPFTNWVNPDIFKDEKGFIITGRDIEQMDGFARVWKNKRDPYILETSMPGIFAAGDVRAGAMARVASAVGEGAMAISMVHKYLGEI